MLQDMTGNPRNDIYKIDRYIFETEKSELIASVEHPNVHNKNYYFERIYKSIPHNIYYKVAYGNTNTQYAIPVIFSEPKSGWKNELLTEQQLALQLYSIARNLNLRNPVVKRTIQEWDLWLKIKEQYPMQLNGGYYNCTEKKGI